jgi:hypothetical protein
MTATVEPVVEIVEPTTEKKGQGWLAGEKPPYNFFNWLFVRVGQWIRYFDKSSSAYDATIGAGDDCTHATLALAIADAGLTTNKRILVRDNITVNTSAISLTKAGWKIYARPGVTITKGTSTSGVSIAAANVELHGFRFAGFTAGGDKAVVLTAAGDYARIMSCNFAVGTTLEVDDTAVTAGKVPVLLANISEV